MAEGSTRLKSIDGVLYDNKVTDLKAYPTHRHAETFILPETVTKMSDKFQGIQYLKTFIGNDALTTVYLQSFQNCPLLETVQLGKRCPRSATAVSRDARISRKWCSVPTTVT